MKALAAAQPATPRRRRRLFVPALVVAVAATVAGGYIALRFARPVVDSPVASAPPAPRSVPVPAVPLARTEPAGTAVATEAKAVVEAPAPHPHANAPRVAQKRVVDLPVASAPAVDRFAAATQPAVVAPVTAADMVPPAREAPAPDRWQVMADQVARCGREGFLAGVVCEQRVRLKYCEGYWGVAAQCPSGIPNDHGR